MALLHTVTALDSAVYTNTANWIGGSAPAADDDVAFQFSSQLNMAGSDQSATELDDIAVLPTCTGGAGTADAYLQLDQGTANSTVFAGGGTWYLDLGTSGSALVRVDRTRSAGSGEAGLYFKNNTSAITQFVVNAGTVRLVEANITTLIVNSGATVYIDSASTVVNVVCNGGLVIDYGSAVTSWTHNQGVGTRYGADAYVATVYGGTLYNDGTGTATATIYGGVFDSRRDGRAKNVTLTVNGGTALIGANVVVTGTFNNGVSITA